MAWRLEEAIEHGIIDNTVEGITTGKIWLAGRDEPLILSLDGDCWRDLAGTMLEFENPEPHIDEEANTLDTDQKGVVGDITASRKARVSEISDEEISEYQRRNREVPCTWRNVLYIEWFSEINGRVLVEAVGYNLNVSAREWDMDEDMEEAQKLANLSTMRDFMATIIRRTEESDDTSTTVRGELNEYEWEERLKESDRLTDAYEEVLEKYMDDPDAERKEAFTMGWDGLLGAMADREESDSDEEEDFDFEHEDWSVPEGFDEDEDDSEDFDFVHPLQARAQEVALRAFDVVRPESEEDSDESFTSLLMQISAKLAGVLNYGGPGYEPEAGFILAVLKRCMNWTNDAIGACNRIIESEKDLDQIAALENLRAEVFSIRDGIIEMRKELKQS